MRIVIAGVWLSGCAKTFCPIDGPIEQSLSCSTEHEPCGRDAACAVGLECVPDMMCTVGPCPGTCLAACEDDEACGAEEQCGPHAFADAAERFCQTHF